MPPASGSTSSAARSSASRPSRADAEQRQHAAERRARAHRAEQVLAVGDGVPADHDLVVDRLRARARGRAARPRARSASAVPHESSTSPSPTAPAPTAALRWSWPPTASTAPRAAGSASPARPERRARERRARAAAPPARPTTRASRPTSRARAGRASRCATRATAPRPARRRAGARPTRRRSASARRAALSGTLSRSQRYFDDRAQRARATAPWWRGSPGSPRRSARASSSPRESCQAIEGTTGSPSRPSSTPVSAMPGDAEADHTRVRHLAPAPRAPPPARSRRTPAGAISAPVGTGVQHQRRLAVRDLLAVGGDDRGLARRRAEVESQQQLPAHGGNLAAGRPEAPRGRSVSRTACRARPGSRPGCPW